MLRCVPCSSFALSRNRQGEAQTITPELRRGDPNSSLSLLILKVSLTGANLTPGQWETDEVENCGPPQGLILSNGTYPELGEAGEKKLPAALTRTRAD